MKVARKWWHFFTVDRKEEITDPDLFERMLKVERELHSAVLEMADLGDFVHRMAKRRYTENYDAAQPPGRTNTKQGGVAVPKVATMTPEQKRALLKQMRGPQ